ncbi:DNA repair protein RecO [Isachenkonia alkalipeptolytica]|uniref:DNA repair protein RecO n=1 Tax=Isachenkonia alkalipeptolytica TaxID=2565777 RepID=A0AA43XM27_9CLOT|nr:DNA repair protein RecO [Isachenkonia alkalipeptolytica]NBG89318.1 DNA repair protein RecO [Isachenkonia alkalipeptolytica]
MLVKTEGIVLKNMKYKENDGILTVFARKLGKVSVMARGARSSKSKHLAGAQPLCYSDFVLYKGKSMYTLNHVDPIHNHYKLREDLDSLSAASFFIELVDTVTIEGQSNNRLFNLFEESLGALERKEGELSLHILRFLLQFLKFSGYEPYLKSCNQCGTGSSFRWVLNMEEGGLLCEDCQSEGRGLAKPLSKKGIRLANFLMVIDIEDLKELKVHPKLIMELESVLKQYMMIHLDKTNFKSLDFLSKIRRDY